MSRKSVNQSFSRAFGNSVENFGTVRHRFVDQREAFGSQRNVGSVESRANSLLDAKRVDRIIHPLGGADLAFKIIDAIQSSRVFVLGGLRARSYRFGLLARRFGKQFAQESLDHENSYITAVARLYPLLSAAATMA